MTLEDRAIWWLALDRITARWEPREYATFADVALLVMSGAQDARDAAIMKSLTHLNPSMRTLRRQLGTHLESLSPKEREIAARLSRGGLFKG